MPYVKDSISILAECAAYDLRDTLTNIRESEIRSSYNTIDEEYFNITAEMVPVVKIDEQYFTETQLLYPYMKDAGINSISEALDNVAFANNLPDKSVGLMFESNECVSGMIEKACKSGSSKSKENVFTKVGKAIGLANNLKQKGYPVKKKKSKNKKK